MRKTNLLDINLRLFDGAAGASVGAASAGSEGSTAQNGAGATPKADTNIKSGSSRRSKSGEPKVVYGKQEDAPAAATDPAAGDINGKGVPKTGVSTTSDALEARRKAFDEMISGEYKDVFAERFQQAFDRRFKDNKVMEQSLNDQKPIIDMLVQKYQIADGDMAKLQAAIEQDDTYWEDAADKAGLTVEQYKAMQKLERENAELKRVREREAANRQRQQGEQMAQQQLAKWYAEGEKLKETYGSFNFEAEAKNKDFTDLLRRGLSVQNAYELIHMEEIKNATAKSAAKAADEQMRARIQSKAARPSENGTSSQGAVITKSDVHSLTAKDRAEAARRAMRGEKIKW